MKFNLTDNLNPLLSFLQSSRNDNVLKAHIYESLSNVMHNSSINNISDVFSIVRNSNTIFNEVLKYLLPNSTSAKSMSELKDIKLLNAIMDSGVIFDEYPDKQFISLINNLSRTIIRINSIIHSKNFGYQEYLFKAYAMTYMNTILMILTLMIKECEYEKEYFDHKAELYANHNPMDSFDSDEPPTGNEYK